MFVRSMGDAALFVELGNEIDEQWNAQVYSLASRITALTGVVECVPAYASLLVEFDPERIAYEELARQVGALLEQAAVENSGPSRVVEIPTRYGGEFGPDLEFVARHNGLSPAEVIAIHTSRPWRVFMLGFTPGFPYIGPLPLSIAAPRLSTPRAHVPAGSVGIAGRQTGIYPRESPGGWQLIGRTDLVLFEPTRDPPTLLMPGDMVQFVKVDK